MPAEYEWRTDEDESHWEEQVPPPRPAAGYAGLGRWVGLPRRPALFVLLVLIVIVGGLFFFLANRQVDKATTAAETEVLQSFLLLQTAAIDDDADLFSTLVDDDSPTWFNLQQKLFRHHLYLDRLQFGLEAKPVISVTAILSDVQVSLNPEFESATLTIKQPYSVQGRGNERDTVVLVRTEILHRKDGAWHLAALPEDEAFWGGWITVRGENVTLIFPAWDEEIGLRLAVALDELIGQICDEVEPVICLPETIQVRLARDADSLMRLNDNLENPFGSISNITLPAPSLVGRPQDEAGYQALYKGYASWLVALLFSELPPNILDGIMAGHDLALPPAPFIPLPETVAYIQEPPGPWPDEDIILFCSTTSSLRVLRYNPRANRWKNELTKEDAPNLSQVQPFFQADVQSTADNSGLLVTFGPSDPDQADASWQTFLWRDGREQRLFDLPGPYYILLDGVQRLFGPSDDRLLIFFYNNASSEPNFGYINYEDCLSGDCEFQDTSGFQMWSPDGQHQLLFDFERDDTVHVVLTDDAEQALWDLKDATWPFWLDNESFGLVKERVIEQAARPPDRITEVVRGRLAPDTAEGYILEPLLDEEDLRMAHPQDTRPGQLNINVVFTNPNWPDRWVISASEDSGRSQYFYLYVPSSGELFPVPEVSDLLAISQPFLSPDSRSMAFFAESGQVLVLDLTSDPSQLVIHTYEGEYNRIDWSSDGKWLVVGGRNQMILAAPSLEFEREIPVELSGCQGITWIKANAAETAGESP